MVAPCWGLAGSSAEPNSRRLTSWFSEVVSTTRVCVWHCCYTWLCCQSPSLLPHCQASWPLSARDSGGSPCWLPIAAWSSPCSGAHCVSPKARSCPLLRGPACHVDRNWVQRLEILQQTWTPRVLPREADSATKCPAPGLCPEPFSALSDMCEGIRSVGSSVDVVHARARQSESAEPRPSGTCSVISAPLPSFSLVGMMTKDTK